jgi:RNA polymerase sigma-70 factor (ECF subfamily)
MSDWQGIVARHSDIVWRTAYRLLGDYHEAADCFQETFLGALEFSRRQRVRSWPALLTRLTTCRALDRLRHRLRQSARHEHVPDWSGVPSGNPSPAQEVQGAELAARLRRALAQLPPKQGEVFSLRYVSELSYGQIAGQLGITKSAAGVLLHRARRHLRQLLEPSPAAKNAEVSP